MTGEISAGLQHRSYVDPRLRDLTAPVVLAGLIWMASPLTTVRFNAATGVTETSVPNSSGVLTPDGDAGGPARPPCATFR